MRTVISIFKDVESCLSYSTIKRAHLFRKLCGNRVIDMLLHMPSYTIEKFYSDTLSENLIGQIVTTKIRIEGIELPNRKSKKPSVIYGKCGDSSVEIVLFNISSQPYIKSAFPVDRNVFISGKLGVSHSNVFQFINPEKLQSQAAAIQTSGFFNIYPLTAGIFQNTIYISIKNAIHLLYDCNIKDWLPKDVLIQNNLPSFQEAMRDIHFPKTSIKSELESASRRRMCFDEMLAEQINMRLYQPRCHNSVAIKNSKTMIGNLLRLLNFSLTESQKCVIQEIFTDMESEKGMTRLLQGDVGSGKTIVAILSALYAIESGFQCAFLAPTEILARQHYRTITQYFLHLGIAAEILTANETGKTRARILENIASGMSMILIGTHAIITEKVQFHNLGLVIIDEQHRFGVGQRLRLIDKGISPHILSMTATPIPRTMIMSRYGDISVSSITEKPSGRTDIITRAVQVNKIPEIVETIRKVIAKGQKVYWICPLIEENTDNDYSCVINRFNHLNEYFRGNIQMLYSKMKSPEKQEIFKSFKEGTTSILVSTTVIEVGIDVPDASIIVIENAEKFGLAQLHQLRGRVGRGTFQSFCILVFDPKLSRVASERIRVLKNSCDGFYIAEKDLLLRGGGEILGTKQSGQKKYKTFDSNSPDNQQIIYETLIQTSKLASEIVDQEIVDNYKTLLEIYTPENPKNIKHSF
jgi:ATP-dependent DNA helicase RecG